jgi:hypothetical protein
MKPLLRESITKKIDNTLNSITKKDTTLKRMYHEKNCRYRFKEKVSRKNRHLSSFGTLQKLTAEPCIYSKIRQEIEDSFNTK